jgi:hypothetical protein
VFLVATDGSLSSLDATSRTPWTAWPAWPSYLPIIQEMLAEAVAGQPAQRNLQVGQSIVEPLQPAQARAPLTLVTPDNRREEIRPTTTAEGASWSLADTSQSGLYALESSSAGAPVELFAVNVDPAESNLARVDPSELPPGLAMNKAASVDEPDEPVAAGRGALSKLLLYAALGLLFTETCLAWRFGNRRA